MSCGNSSNVTPVEIIGQYRGLEVNKGYKSGEWSMTLTGLQVIIKDPSNNVWATGSAATYNDELWLVTSKGKYRGIWETQVLPEVTSLTWALGPLNGPVPESFDDGLSKGTVFTFFKCINSQICQWILQSERAKRKEATESRLRSRAVDDPCSKYPDCETCVKAKDYCGWCSVDVLYNATVPGTQCAGLNQSKIPGFLCEGTFSTIDCPTRPPNPKTKAPTRHPPVPIPPLKPSAPHVKPPPTNEVTSYICNPSNQTCTPGPGGMPLYQCNLSCNVIPDVPVVLRGRKFRGLEINQGYEQGEWTCKFTTTTATITDPKGIVLTAIVSQTGEYLVLNLDNGKKVFTLWQLGQGSVIDFLSWAWGDSGGNPPASFDASMTTAGETSYVFDACSSLSQVCNFGK